jgi:hypothetical protein
MPKLLRTGGIGWTDARAGFPVGRVPLHPGSPALAPILLKNPLSMAASLRARRTGCAIPQVMRFDVLTKRPPIPRIGHNALRPIPCGDVNHHVP